MDSLFCILLPEGKSLQHCLSQMMGGRGVLWGSTLVKSHGVESISQEKWAGFFLARDNASLWPTVNLAFLTTYSVQALCPVLGKQRGLRHGP